MLDHQPVTDEQIARARKKIATMPNLKRCAEPTQPDDLWEAGMPIIVMLGAFVIELLVYAGLTWWWS